MRVTAALRKADPLQWLGSLKGDHLRHLAHKTGTNSTGTKPLLVQRLRRDLHLSEYHPARLPSPFDPTEKVEPREMRVLSIDMGVRNLAYAHFIVPRDERIRITDPDRPLPYLTGWRNMSLDDIADLEPYANSVTTKPHPKKHKKIEDRDEQEKRSIATDTYARHAYNFVASVVGKYRPTHVLIERQRLRTRSSIGVLESVLRVAMFESMIHAALYAVQRERGLETYVQGVDPGMVVASIDRDLLQFIDRPSKVRSMAGNEPKKARVDLVGRWLVDWAESEGLLADVNEETGLDVAGEEVELPAPGMKPGPGEIDPHHFRRIRVADDPAIREFAVSYLKEWHRNVMRRRVRHSALPTNVTERRLRAAAKMHGDIGIYKLDDLADCLVQGLVWLDWHIMRDKVSREGARAVQWS